MSNCMKNFYFTIKLLKSGKWQIARRAWFWHVTSQMYFSDIYRPLIVNKLVLFLVINIFIYSLIYILKTIGKVN